MGLFDIVIFGLIRNFIRGLMDKLTYRKLLEFDIGYRLLLLGMEVGLLELRMDLGLLFAWIFDYIINLTIILYIEFN
jgi:hypothetical protein